MLKLELWQKAFISCLFGIVDETGSRQFRECFLCVGRKDGKTLLASAIANFCAFLDGEYGGRLYFAAPKLEQAALCYESFFHTIEKEPELSDLAKKRRTDIYIPSTNTSARPLAFNAKKSDGLNISLAICDEIASWRGDAGIKFYEVLKSSVGARKQPLLLSISTAGYENDGVFDELMARAVRLLNGTSRETRLLPIIYKIDDVNRWNDINELRKSIPNLGVSVSIDYMLEEIAIAEASPAKYAEFMTKYCNVKQNSSIAWLDADVVEQCSGDELRLEDFERSYCVGGIDLSQTTDLTSCCVVIERDGELYVFSKFFMPAGKLQDATARDGIPYELYVKRGLLQLSGENFVDYKDCFAWFNLLLRKYKILPLQVGYDRYSAQYLIQDMEAAGFHCDDVYQGENLYPVLMEAEGLMKDGKIHIGNNDLLKIHMLDSAIKMSQERGRGKLVKVDPRCHIDGMAALVDALTVRQKWHDEIGHQLSNKRKSR